MLESKDFLTGEELSAAELVALLKEAAELKKERSQGQVRSELKGKSLALLLEKPSARTHLSFAVAVHELGGHLIESYGMNRKPEEPEDLARVISGYCHALIWRTFSHSLVERLASRASIPVINGLSDSHHPCQALADLLTLRERFNGELRGRTLTYVGDGNNVLHSLLLMSPKAGLNVRYSTPVGYEPDSLILKRALDFAGKLGTTIDICDTPLEACKGVDALYTDVWTSMGQESQADDRRRIFKDYQINDALLDVAAPHAVVMHCLPMVRGQEITDSAADHTRSVIFSQSENRLHVQKALLLSLLKH